MLEFKIRPLRSKAHSPGNKDFIFPKVFYNTLCSIRAEGQSFRKLSFMYKPELLNGSSFALITTRINASQTVFP
jgi:hypothetical protein